MAGREEEDPQTPLTRILWIRPEAESDLSEAYSWYEEQSPGLGADFLLSFDAVQSSILRNPLQYPEVHQPVRRVLIRRFPYGVFFLVEDLRIIVFAVFHASRDPQGWKDRLR